MDSIDQVKIKLSSKIGKKTPLFVSEFSNGRLLSHSEVEFECFKSEKFKSTTENEHDKRKLMATNGRLTYTGDSNDASALRYYVGVRNINTGKMKLYDSTLFRLKPVLHCNANANDNISRENNYWEDRNKLTEQFGGKTQQRMLKSRLRLDVKDDSLEELLNDSIDSSPLPSDPFVNSPSCASYLPPSNKDASSVDEVFDVNDIIPPEIDASLQEHANSWFETYKVDADTAKQNLCKFVLFHIDESWDNLDKLKYLLYYNYLVVFQRLTYSDIRKKDPTNDIPEPFKTNMLDRFTSVNKSERGRPSRNFPSEQKDRVVSHLLVLALLINNYCVSISRMLPDLRQVFPTKIINIAQAMGCHITSQKVEGKIEKFIALKLPLNVVMPKSKKRQF